MRIKGVIEKNSNALPGYELVGYSELAIPVFNKKLEVLILSEKSIPIVEQFFLNFYNEGMDNEEIMKVLGLSKELVNEAWIGLIQRDYIDGFTKKITTIGREYLDKLEIKKTEKREISISIDGLIGKVSKINKNLMLPKTVKERGLKSINSEFKNVDLIDLNFKDIKEVYKKYKKDDEFYSGDLLEVINIKGVNTRYKKIDILIFQNSYEEMRILAFDGYDKIEGYEEKLLQMEDDGISVLYFDNDVYTNDYNKNQIFNINEDMKKIKLNEINNKLEEYLINKDGLIFVLPLIDSKCIDFSFLEKIESMLKENKKLSIILSGNEFVNEHQQSLLTILIKKMRDNNMEIRQVPIHIDKMIINTSKKKILTLLYDEYNVNSNGTRKGKVDVAYEFVKEDFDIIYDNLNNTLHSCKEPQLQNLFKNNYVLKEKIKKIIELAKDCDSLIWNYDEIGWFDQTGIPQSEKLLDIKLVEKDNDFKEFINTLNKCLVESLEFNAKIKGKRKHFWNGFKINYKELFIILDKIKTYRNKSNHLKLDYNNRNKYLMYLKEDLNGFLPELIDNGYLILQEKILFELEKSIRTTLEKLK
ncbi:hypothetical protein QYB60_001769 [Clostridium perfringens]|nr:hypothetical protein [Clostridium perfringens]